MFYEFPRIEHINDVLPHIDDNFIVANKGEYTVINYILPDKETFPPVTDLRSAIRRECRGIIFCNVTGKILRRPYGKWFNISEREDYSEEIVMSAMVNNSYKALEKLDGSMISAFRTHSGELIWGSKMGFTHLSPKVEEFVDIHTEYRSFVEHCEVLGLTAIFEWYSPEDRIVIDYGKEPLMILTAVRHTVDGNYVDQVFHIAENVYNIPTVRSCGRLSFGQIKQEQAENTTDEGYVIRFDNGHMVKIKHEHYCKIHRAKSSLAKERHIVDLILNQKIDDLKPFLDQEEIKKLEHFENSLSQKLKNMVYTFDSNMSIAHIHGLTKKDLALKYKDKTPPWLMSLMFKFHSTNYTNEQVYAEIEKYILKYCTRDNKYQEFMVDDVLSDVVRWKPVMFSGDN